MEKFSNDVFGDPNINLVNYPVNHKSTHNLLQKDNTKNNRLHFKYLTLEIN